MNLRENALASLNGKEVYPVPVDVWENGIHPILENGLCSYFGLEKEDHEGVLKKLNACMRWGGPVYIGPELENADLNVSIPFPFKKITKNIWGTWDGLETYSGLFKRPLAEVSTVAQIENYPWPNPDWFDYNLICWLSDTWEKKIPIAQWAAEHSENLRFVAGWNPVFSRLMDMFGMEDGLMNICAEPKLIEAAIRCIEDFYVEYYTRVAQASSGLADIVGYGDDFAGQLNMMIDPETWRKLFLPTWKKLFEIGHKYGMKTQMHMCGNIRPVLGDLIDAGLDIYENLQTYAADMEPGSLKKEFGNDVVFYGGIDVQRILPFATAQEVRDEVMRFIDIMGKNGKYILASSHFLLEDIPYENVVAMYECANNYKR